jgi:endonuclease YncB( thermonuclease family)
VGLIYLDGDLANLKMIEKGQAWVYDQYCKAKEVCQRFREAQASAQSAKIGLWSYPSPKPPWEHRADKRTKPAKRK